MSRPLVVLQLISNLRVGGAQSVVVALCNELLRTGQTVVLVTLGESGPSADRLRRSPALHVYHLDLRRRSLLLLPWFLVSVTRIVWRLVRIMRKHQVDVVQSHMGDSNLLGMLAARLAGVPRRFPTFHSLVFLARTNRDDARNRLARRILRFYGHIVTAFVAISDAVRSQVIALIGIPPERVVTVLNGIELPPPVPAARRAQKRVELELEDDQQVLICVGRLNRAKGQRHLLHAVALLAPDFPRLVCLLVGDGEERAALEGLTTELGIRPNLRFLGSRQDVAEILAVGQGFVLPSEWEGLPMALLEAMAAGLPCVATAVAGTAEVIDGENGRLVAPCDPTALAAAIRSLLGDPAAAARMGLRGQADVSARFGMQGVCARYLALYRDLPLPACAPSSSS